MAVVPENTQSSFWSDLIDNAVPALTAAGLTMSSNASNNKASDALMRTTADAANVINSGYDEQLAALQKGYDYLRGLSGQQLEDVTASGKQNVGDYADQMYGNVDAYAGELLPYFQNYGQSITGNTGNYISNLGDVQNSAEGTLQGAYDTAAAEIAPYAQSGQQANEYLSTILGSDPSQMTASQRVAYDNAKRDALAALAASSLRGSGRAGVYSVSKALADQQAAMEATNRARMDSAANTLNSSGQSAANSLASNRTSLGTNLSNIRTTFGNKAADTALTTSNDLASKAYGLGADIAGKGLTVGNDVASKSFTQGQQTTQNIADNYGNIASIEAARNAAVAGTPLQKAQTTAAAMSSNAATSYGNTTNAGNNMNRLFGQLAGTYLTQNKKTQTDESNSNTNNGKA